MKHSNRTQRLQAALLLVLSTLLLQGQAYAGAPADAVPVNITGELTVLYADDFENKRAELQYFIEDKQSKKRFRLQFDGTPPGHLRTGKTITVRGKAKGKEVYLAADGVDSSSSQTFAPAIATVTGEQRTIVMVADFTDATTSCSVNAIRDLMFTDPANQSVDDLYQETSLGQVSFSGDVVGRYNINFSSTDACDVNAWAAAADTEAQNSGVDLSLYDRKVYVLPDINTCGWSGLASVGGNPSYAWIMRCDLEAVFGHELGHNLGMNHASTLSSEYGDTSDIMGSAMSGLRQINGAHQEQMGWRTPDKIMTVTQPGTFDIAPLELNAAQVLAPQIIKIAKPDSGESYYLSYRQPIGFDANLSTTLTERLHVHLYNGNGGRTTLLSGLLQGASFVDDVNGITLTHVSHTPDYVTVQVSLDGSTPPPTCTPTAPLVNISPSSQSANAGSTLNYSVSITNNDNTACANSTFGINDNIPSGWAGALSPTSLSLAPGQTGTAILSVTSATSTTASTYSVGVSVTDSSEAVHSASTSASYTVVQACATAAPGLSLSPDSQSGDAGATLAYTISLMNNDSTACSASTFDLTITSLPGGWDGSLSTWSLSVAPGATATATLSVTSAQGEIAGNYGVQLGTADAQEPVHARSTTANYLVNDSTSTGDTEAPTVPSAMAASANFKQVSLSWNPSSDNVGVAGYRVYRDGVVIASTLDTGYTDRDGASGVTYEYSVDAYDAANNASAKSTPVSSGKAKAKAKGGGKGKGPGK